MTYRSQIQDSQRFALRGERGISKKGLPKAPKNPRTQPRISALSAFPASASLARSAASRLRSATALPSCARSSSAREVAAAAAARSLSTDPAAVAPLTGVHRPLEFASQGEGAGAPGPTLEHAGHVAAALACCASSLSIRLCFSLSATRASRSSPDSRSSSSRHAWVWLCASSCAFCSRSTRSMSCRMSRTARRSDSTCVTRQQREKTQGAFLRDSRGFPPLHVYHKAADPFVGFSRRSDRQLAPLFRKRPAAATLRPPRFRGSLRCARFPPQCHPGTPAPRQTCGPECGTAGHAVRPSRPGRCRSHFQDSKAQLLRRPRAPSHPEPRGAGFPRTATENSQRKKKFFMSTADY
ncbi:MAG: hypothetical protein BJ554DRAFT_4714 [Olpidium bornovanus]|uniref:Uncharacterized protein n=1 Tax=Olpidium bornovanus TaxID=278681 RepID=A0A8H7ZLW6_9FUNG|nr:MAG: hypothetical protein BJ554DRAFT_4714 [Olpidium bornovanus]